MKYFKTSDIARLVHVHPNTVRLYEEWGLLPPISRGSNGYRLFTQMHLEQVKLIRLSTGCTFLGGRIRRQALGLMHSSAEGHMAEALQQADQLLVMIGAERRQAEEAEKYLEEWARSKGKGTAVQGAAVECLGTAVEIREPTETAARRKADKTAVDAPDYDAAADDARYRDAKSDGARRCCAELDDFQDCCTESEGTSSHDAAADSPAQSLSIQEAAALLDVSIDMLRDWERNGLINIPRNPENGYRRYGLHEINKLRVIRVLRRSRYSNMSILRVLQQLDAGQAANLREIIDTPEFDAERGYLCFTNNLLSSLECAERSANNMITQLSHMSRLTTEIS